MLSIITLRPLISLLLRGLAPLLICSVWLVPVIGTTASAQSSPGDNGQDEASSDEATDNVDDNGGGNNNTDDQIAPGGVAIDASAALNRLRGNRRQRGNLALDREVLVGSSLPRNPARPSLLRKVSLTRLEQAASQAMQRDGTLSDEMSYLAGLTRIEYVFAIPATGDVIIAGPAGGWLPRADGLVLNAGSHQPVVRLEDLVVMLRAFPPEGERNKVIACSIDPTQEGLARLQAYLRRIGSRPPSVATLVRQLRNHLGEHKVTITGLPTSTRLADVMLTADYHMKLIGIGLAETPVGITSYVELARPGSRMNCLARWYLVPRYEDIELDEEALILHLGGHGVKLMTEVELVARNGDRKPDDRRDPASERFAKSFTKAYDRLSQHVPIYAELQTVMDLSLMGAFLQECEVYDRCAWHPDFFYDEDRFTVEQHPTQSTVDTAANAIWKGNRLMTPVGGGVEIRPGLELSRAGEYATGKTTELQPSPAVEVLESLAVGQWWWD